VGHGRVDPAGHEAALDHAPRVAHVRAGLVFDDRAALRVHLDPADQPQGAVEILNTSRIVVGHAGSICFVSGL